MPELPDIVVYIEALQERILGHTLEHVRLNTPFLLRTADPPIKDAEGKRVVGFRRIGKRIAIGLEGDLWLILHLMIAGRLHWKTELKVSGSAGSSKLRKDAGAKIAGKVQLAAFDFDNGTLTLTEAGSKRRASLHFVRGEKALEAIDPGGLEVMGATLDQFAESLQSANHTVKRALTDPHLFSGIGNAYSDEILFEARLSPIKLTQKLTAVEITRLYEAVKSSLAIWTERLRQEAGGEFPEKVTAFRKDMAVHGRFGAPCPVCQTPIQRIRYADNETNYCVNCQTDGRLLADRALSRLLKEDWPRSLDELDLRNSKLR